MTSLADVFTDQESTNWLKAWLAVDITKAGLESFVCEEIQTVHSQIFKSIRAKLNLPATASCPTPGKCKTRSQKQSWRCPIKLCDEVHDEIIRYHRYRIPSWKNTSADQWASNPWQIAKCFMPPDGYTNINTVQDTDFNGVISVLLNCKHFDNKVSFTIQPPGPNVSCLLTKGRQIGKALRHSSKCKVSIADLQDYFTTLTTLLSDPKCLAQDCEAQKAIKKLKELQNDSFTIAERDLCVLLKAANKVLTAAQEVAEGAREDIEKYIKRLQNTQEDHVNEKEFIRLLKKHYTTTLLYDAIDGSDIESQIKSIEEIYATPKIHRIRNFKRLFQVKKYEDIFFTQGKLNSRIFLKGEAGTGKSTFAVKLVLDWCRDSKPYQKSENEKGTSVASGIKIGNTVLSTSSNGDNPQEPTEIIIYERQALMFEDTETLMKFQCVFLITLREFDNDTDVVQMIKQQIVDKMYAEDDRKVAGTLFQEILKKENCLIIQDGLDEWTVGKEALPLIVAGHSQCTVLITTRPWKMTDERIKNIDITLELDGLNDPYALSSIIIERRNKKEAYAKKADFVKYIENNSSLKDLLPSPMLLKLIVNMWMDGIMLSGSLCEIYSILLDNLLKKVTTSKGYFHPPPVFCFERTKHIKPNIAYFNAISKLAFSMLFSFERKSSIVFSDRELSEYLLDDQKLFALNAGILSERKGNTLSNLCTSSFVHKSVQEFLAAYHITMNAGVIDEQVRKYIEQFSNTDFKQLYVFLMGMNGEQSAKLRKLIEATIGKDDASLKNDLGRATTGAFRSQSSDAASAKELQFQSLIMAGNKEAEAVKRMATDKHDPSKLVHSADNHIEGRLLIFNIKTHGWRKQYVVVSCRKVLFYSSEADRHTSIPMRVLDIEKITKVTQGRRCNCNYGADATFIPRIFQVLYSTEGKNRNTEENPEEINSLIKSKSDNIDHKSPEFIELHFRTPTTCDSCNKPMWHIHPPNVTECRHCHFKLHRDEREERLGCYCKNCHLKLHKDDFDEWEEMLVYCRDCHFKLHRDEREERLGCYCKKCHFKLHKDDFDEREDGLGCYCTAKFDHNKHSNKLLLLADSADDQQTWVTHLSKKISTKCTFNQETIGAPIQPDHVNQTSAANQVIIVQKQTRHIFRDHTRISNICETASGELVITDRRNWSVELLNSTYAVVYNLQLPEQPKSMCSTDGNTVAIVVGYNQVFFIKTTNAQLVKDRTLELQHKCLGIAHRKGTIYITSGTTLYQYTVDGEMVGYIYMDRGLRATSCAVSPDGDRIYLVDVKGHQLITLSRDGTVISTLSDSKLERRYTDLHGLHVTDLGQVLVCGGHWSDKIFQVDKDGKQILAKVVTEKETGKISSVFYSTRTNKLIVGTLYNDSLIEYSLQYLVTYLKCK